MTPTRRTVLQSITAWMLTRILPTSTTAYWHDISGATGHAYTPTSVDVNHQLRCKVTAHNSAGHATIRTSASNAVKGA